MTDEAQTSSENESAATTTQDEADDGAAPRCTLLVAHGHRLYLHGLVRILDDVESLDLVGCAETEEQLLLSAERAKPQIAIFAPFQPLPGGLAVLERLQHASATTKALLILQTADPALLIATIRAGAWGYFSPDAMAQDIVRAIHATTKGELWVERRVMRRLLLVGTSASSAGDGGEGTCVAGAQFDLSEREREVAAQVIAGLCNKRIGAKLRIAESTVKAHLVSIFRKVDVENRIQLAIRLGDNHSIR